MKSTKIFAAAALAVAFGAGSAWSEDAVPVRFAVIGSSGQNEVPYAVQQFGLDKKHGLAMEVMDYAMPGQQYTMYKSDATDVSAGNFIDLLRQRKAGLGLQAFHGFQGYSNLIVAKPDSPIKSFADLKGKKVGEFGPTFLDWLILRAAGKKAYGIDLQNDATLVQGAPPLLNQFLAKGDVDATLQFSSLTFGPILKGEQKQVADIRDVMRAAGFDPDAFYLHWQVTEKWTKAHPDAVVRLSAMLDDAYAKLKSDDSVWPALAQKINITDPKIADAYRNEARKIDNPPYRKALIPPTQALMDSIVAIAGEAAVGVTQVDPAAFWFPAGS
ncbi:MAG TPA: ABC transporter substrate-binding protein [Stellaceae bacterium]|nr:ABC transporter substrate-binding protein [Stellaceae bacterium]